MLSICKCRKNDKPKRYLVCGECFKHMSEFEKNAYRKKSETQKAGTLRRWQ